jgi:tetratricopeptide (TPR) repeat protein
MTGFPQLLSARIRCAFVVVMLVAVGTWIAPACGAGQHAPSPRAAAAPADKRGAAPGTGVGDEATTADDVAAADSAATDAKLAAADGDAGDADESSPTARAKPAPGPTASAGADAKLAPSRPAAELSQFLVGPAEAAMKKRDYAQAVSLYRGLVTARGTADPIALELAKAWRLGEAYDEAIDVYQQFAAATTDAGAGTKARQEAETLRNTPRAFRRPFQVQPAAKEAVQSFQLGRKAFKKKQHSDALFYFLIANALNPDMAGPVRELGAVYGKLSVPEKETEFYLSYLRRRPLGKLATEVRKRFGKRTKTELGALTLTSSLPCEEVWIEGQPVPDKLPLEDLLVAPGRYKALCFNPQYEIAYFETADVVAGKPTTLAFRWAILVNDLANPYGRIALEHWSRPGTMVDLGITNPAIGVPIPTDGRALRMLLKADDGTREEERFIRFEPGERKAVKW